MFKGGLGGEHRRHHPSVADSLRDHASHRGLANAASKSPPAPAERNSERRTTKRHGCPTPRLLKRPLQKPSWPTWNRPAPSYPKTCGISENSACASREECRRRIRLRALHRRTFTPGVCSCRAPPALLSFGFAGDGSPGSPFLEALLVEVRGDLGGLIAEEDPLGRSLGVDDLENRRPETDRLGAGVPSHAGGHRQRLRAWRREAGATER